MQVVIHIFTRNPSLLNPHIHSLPKQSIYKKTSSPLTLSINRQCLRFIDARLLNHVKTSLQILHFITLPLIYTRFSIMYILLRFVYMTNTRLVHTFHYFLPLFINAYDSTSGTLALPENKLVNVTLAWRAINSPKART